MLNSFRSLAVLLFICALVLLPTGCTPSAPDVTPAPAPGTSPAPKPASVEYLRPSAALVGNVVIISTKDPVQRANVANYLYSSAVAVRTLMGSNTVTVEEFERTLKSFLPEEGEAQEWAQLATSLSSLYGSVRPAALENPNQYLKSLELIARGLEDAASPWVNRK